MSRRAFPLVVGAFLLSCAPAAPEPVAPRVVSAPPPVAPVPMSSHATWRFARAIAQAYAELDLGDKGVLQVGRGGRRWRINKDGTVETAAVLFAEDLLDVRRVGNRFVFLATNGTVYLADDALGTPTATHTSPTDKPRYAIGKFALVGAMEGTLLRSTDSGATWTKSKSPTNDRVASIVGNARGELVLLTHPQRAFLSTDDGVTWSPLPTPGIGARIFLRDAKGDLWLEGALSEKLAKLTNGKLEVSTGIVELKPINLKDPPSKKNEPRRALAGNRLVSITEEIEPTTKRKKIEVTVNALAGEPGQPFVVAPSASPMTRLRTAGYDNNVVIAVYDPEVEPRAVRLFRTTDDGKTWDPLTPLEGSEGMSFNVLAGPNVIVVSEMCTPTPPCVGPRVKVGSKDWQPLGVPQTSRLVAIEVDGERLVVVTFEAGGTAIYSGKPGPLKKLDVALGKELPVAAALDKNGTIRLAYRQKWRIDKIANNKLSSVYLPFAPDGVDLAGDRAFAWSHEIAWESADGGDHWTRVASGGAGFASCGTEGCLQGTAIRVGWDLPDAQKPLIAATDTPGTPGTPGSPGSSEKPPPPLPPPAPVACTATGPFKTYAGHIHPRNTLGLDGDVRFIALGPNYNLTVARGTAQPQVVTLMPAAKKLNLNVTVREWNTTTAAGHVEIRYSYSTVVKADADGGKKYNPVDVALGWYNAKTGKAHKAQLNAVKPFRVGTTGPSALTSIIDGGLLFLPNRGEAPLHILREDGKTDTIPRPTGVDEFGFTDGTKVGDRIVLTQIRDDDVAVVMSQDNGKTWSTAVWSLGEPSTFGLLDKKPAFLLGIGMFGGGELTGALAFDAVVNDPPAAQRPMGKVTPIDENGIHACVGKPGVRFLSSPDVSREAKLSITLDKETLEPTTNSVWSRYLADGSTCAETLFAFTSEDEAAFAIVPAADPSHSWFVQTKPWEPKFDARPLSCSF